jgi:hypothetical protein
VRRTQESLSVRSNSSDRLSDPVLLSNVFPRPGQVGKVLGERWKALNEKQRGPYEAKAAQDKKRYEDEKATYNVCLLQAACTSRRPITQEC